MPLAEVEFTPCTERLPPDVAAFLREADTRLTEFLGHSPARAGGFVPSDAATVYRALRTIAEQELAPGNLFCEWGSGFGLAASLGSMLGFDACGIEIQDFLVDSARQLAEDFELQVEFVRGSFVPPGGEELCEELYGGGDFHWLVTDADDAYDELGLAPDDFDLVFAYPWPDEEYVIEDLFERFAATGALLAIYSDEHGVRLRRKVRRRGRRPRDR